jgi:hypothetical protein
MTSDLLQHADSLAREAPYEERYWARATPGTSAVEGMTEADFAAEFKTKPFEAIRTLRAFVEFGLVTTVDATKWLFPLILKVRGDLRDHIYEVLLDFKEPDTLLSTALVEYRRYGNEERLVVAASLLADIGADALPALRVLARSRSPECEMFVSVIAHLGAVSLQDRLGLLAELASNPGSDVRYSLLESLRAFPSHHILPLLKTLSKDGDEEIASKARAWLESLEAESQKSILPSAGFEIDIEEPEVLRMPSPETKSLSATVVNRGPAKPRLVLDVIADEE